MKKFSLLGGIVLALLIMLAGTAFACPNPDISCSGKNYASMYKDENKHLLMCMKCRYQFLEDHWGGVATCTSRAICGSCKKEYGGYAHSFTEWRDSGNKTHTLTCAKCSLPTGNPIPCSGPAATCTSPQICTVCGYIITTQLGHDFIYHDAKAPTCTEIGWDEYETCSRCDYTTTYKQIDALGHDLIHHDAKAPTCTEGGWDEYDTCSRCDYDTILALPDLGGHDLIQHDAQEPTCTDIGWNAFKGCSRCDYKEGYQEIPALGHDYRVIQTQRPTCTRSGFTEYVCANCQDSKRDIIPALFHWYGSWTSNGDGTHSAACRRDDCEYLQTRECAEYAVTVNDSVWNICPVCGMLGEQQMVLIPQANVVALSKNAVPDRGETTVFGLNAPFDNALFALTLAREYDGHVLPYNGMVSVKLPVEVVGDFRLVHVGADGEQTEIEYQYQNGVLSYKTNQSGLFLLLSDSNP